MDSLLLHSRSRRSAMHVEQAFEITDYPASGYEIAFGSSSTQYDSYIASAGDAIASWKSSELHDAVITNEGQWSDRSWIALGIGIFKGFATVWFGEVVDERGSPPPCDR
jgi:hypothetical protein